MRLTMDKMGGVPSVTTVAELDTVDQDSVRGSMRVTEAVLDVLTEPIQARKKLEIVQNYRRSRGLTVHDVFEPG